MRVIRHAWLVVVVAACSGSGSGSTNGTAGGSASACPADALRGAEFCIALPHRFRERSVTVLDGWDTRDYAENDTACPGLTTDGCLLMRVNPNARYEDELANSTIGSGSDVRDLTSG